MDIRPIRTEEDYDWAINEIETLINTEPGTPEFDRLEVLAILVETYEDEHYPIELPDPIEAIKYWMETKNLSRADLEPSLGSRGRVAEILNRNRRLTLRMIRNLESNLGIPADLLIKEYSLNEPVVGEDAFRVLDTTLRIIYEEIVYLSENDSTTVKLTDDLEYSSRGTQLYINPTINKMVSQNVNKEARRSLIINSDKGSISSSTIYPSA